MYPLRGSYGRNHLIEKKSIFGDKEDFKKWEKIKVILWMAFTARPPILTVVKFKLKYVIEQIWTDKPQCSLRTQKEVFIAAEKFIENGV